MDGLRLTSLRMGCCALDMSSVPHGPPRDPHGVRPRDALIPTNPQRAGRARGLWRVGAPGVCVNMDKYLSMYIGRPVAIFKRNFDTGLPSVDDVRAVAF